MFILVLCDFLLKGNMSCNTVVLLFCVYLGQPFSVWCLHLVALLVVCGWVFGMRTRYGHFFVCMCCGLYLCCKLGYVIFQMASSLL